VFIEAVDDRGGGNNWITGAKSRAKLQSNHHNQHQFFQTGCSSCRPTNSVKALKENITFHGLAYPKLTWGLPALSLSGDRKGIVPLKLSNPQPPKAVL